MTDRAMKMAKAALIFWKSGRNSTALDPRQCQEWGRMLMRVRLTTLSPLLTSWTTSRCLINSSFLSLVSVFSPTLEADLGSCTKESSPQNVTITFTIVKIRSDKTWRKLLVILDNLRFYVFWCVWFQITVVEVKIITLETSFGSSPSPSPAPSLVIFLPDLLAPDYSLVCRWWQLSQEAGITRSSREWCLNNSLKKQTNNVDWGTLAFIHIVKMINGNTFKSQD